MRGVIFDIQRMSMNDGPGIRTVVFLKGCPLRCVWCHNPESFAFQPELLYDDRKCTRCGRCASVCAAHVLSPQGHGLHRAGCRACFCCTQACLADALEICGRDVDAQEVLDTVALDHVFYKASGGGMTLSGGEPLSQPGFAHALAKGAQARGTSVCVETSGYAPWKALEALLPYVQYFLVDYKETDPQKHLQFTGVDNALILENLRRLNDAHARIILRCPIVPGCNDRDDHFIAIAALAQRLDRVERIDVEPYHPLGGDKRKRLGYSRACDLSLSLPTNEQRETWLRRIQAETHTPVAEA